MTCFSRPRRFVWPSGPLQRSEPLERLCLLRPPQGMGRKEFWSGFHLSRDLVGQRGFWAHPGACKPRAELAYPKAGSQAWGGERDDMTEEDGRQVGSSI